MAFEYHAAALMTFTDAGPIQYRIITSSAYTGSILSMLPIHQTYTYTLTFQGPKLRCDDVKNHSAFDLAQVNTTNTKSATTTYNATVPIHSFDYAALPAEYAFDIGFATPMRNFTCETWNVTYTVDFSFVNGEQRVAVTDTRYDNRFVLGYGTDWYYCKYDWNFPGHRADNLTTTPVDLIVSATELVYSYNPRSLLLSYATAALATIIIMLAGFHALWSNGVGHTNTFSGLIRTVRGKDLDNWA
ncbi:hypothetical protein TW65_07846 [Stemphylium lycopersici]|nr:hypothetical protein TW65_07846 [Stemphylium lycopersici]